MAANTFGAERFSPMQFLSRRREQAARAGAAPTGAQQPASPDGEAFRQVVDLMRSVLIASRGITEEEQAAYNRRLNEAVLGYPEARRQMKAFIQDELVKRRLLHVAVPDAAYDSLAEAVFAEIIGLNVLELIMKQKEGLEEIQVVGTRIFEVRHGVCMPSRYRFRSLAEVRRIQQNLVLFNNEVFNPRKKWAEVMLVDGARVTLTGFGFTSEPTMTIRFFPVERYDLERLTDPAFATLDPFMPTLLRALVRSSLNLVIIGATNTGKTHLMKCLIAEMPEYERIVTIESRFELQLTRDFPHRNIIEYEVGESDAHSAERAFALALRQSPRRIVHAEIRDEDANLYVRACTRGHEGSMTTVHVSALEDVPDAVTDMCMLDRRGMNPERLRRRIVEYVCRIGIEMALVQGKRRLVRLVEYGWQDGRVSVRDIVRFDPDSGAWRYGERFSRDVSERIRLRDPEGYAALRDKGLITA
jgi:pilus assembly protein CpaF